MSPGAQTQIRRAPFEVQNGLMQPQFGLRRAQPRGLLTIKPSHGQDEHSGLECWMPVLGMVPVKADRYTLQTVRAYMDAKGSEIVGVVAAGVFASHPLIKRISGVIT